MDAGPEAVAGIGATNAIKKLKDAPTNVLNFRLKVNMN
jgi:hypothetical protein